MLFPMSGPASAALKTISVYKELNGKTASVTAYKTNKIPLKAKVELTSDGSSVSVITYLRSGKKLLHNSS